MANIHSTAQVDSRAELADDVEVGAFTIIGPQVTIGAGSVIGPHTVLTGHTTLGKGNRIFQFCSIGEISQDKKYKGEPVTTTIGDNNTFREFVTIHAGTVQDRSDTLIGNGNWLLAYVHIAHDCVVGNHTVFSNSTQLSGHVHVGDHVTMGGFSGVHQFCRIGAHAMVAAGSIVVQDIPPYMTVAGYPAKPAGTNNEGLRRRGFSPEEIMAVRRAYKVLYREGLGLKEAIAKISEEAQQFPILNALLRFIEAEGRGLAR